MTNELGKVEKLWDEQALEWNQLAGDHGDRNRTESSDICLWKYVGNTDNQIVILDAGCGNGYLTIKFALETQAKHVIGIDLSSVAVKIAKENIERRVQQEKDRQRITINHDSVTELKSIEDNSIDLIIANYVLMDIPDLDFVIKAFERVLKPSGRVVIAITHPCFDVMPEKNGAKRIFTWTKSYFDETSERQEWGAFSLNISIIDHYQFIFKRSKNMV
ncbi:hypothetical protein I4U23_002924 [Adineta vaga]|nr:hypothetical protein I4U23_002924 [Adineta vaga]